MKKLIYILAIISSGVLVSSYTIKKEFKESVQYDDYCDGWEDGYCEGYRDVKSSSNMYLYKPALGQNR